MANKLVIIIYLAGTLIVWRSLWLFWWRLSVQEPIEEPSQFMAGAVHLTMFLLSGIASAILWHFIALAWLVGTYYQRRVSEEAIATETNDQEASQ